MFFLYNSLKYWNEKEENMKKFIALLSLGMISVFLWSCAPVANYGGVPTGVSASQGTYSNKIRIEWSQVEGADSYNVYRSAVQFGTYELLAERTVLFYDDANVNSGDVLYYQVSSVSGGVESDKSTAVMGSVSSNGGAGGTLDAPTGIGATDAVGTSVTVSWVAVSGATSYSIWRSTSYNGTYSEIGTSSTTSYSDTTATADVYYYYKVKAINDSTESELSASWAVGYWVLNPIPSISSVTKYLYSDQVEVDWYLSSSPATNYNIYRSDASNGTFTLIDSVTPPTTIYADTTVTAGQVYWYTVTTVTSNGESLQDDPEWGIAADKAPDAPASITITGWDAEAIDLAWEPSDQPYGYYIYSSTSASGPWDKAFSFFPNTYYGDTNETLDFYWDDLLPGTNYYFQVVASNALGVSSGTVTATSGAITVVAEDGSEPNNTTNTATPFGTFGTAKTLSVDNLGGDQDVDYIAFTGTAGNDYSITLTYPGDRFSTYLYLYKSGFSGTYDYIDYEFGSSDHTINFSCTETDVYYVKVSGFMSYNAGDYQLNIVQQ